MRLRSIEGPSFAGKSTLARHITETHGGMFIGEYMDYAITNGRSGFPPLPATVEEAKRGVDFFMDIERERTNDIRKGLCDGLLVVSDRTVLSLAAYQLALYRHRDSLPGDQIAVPDYAIEKIQNATEKGDIEMPEKLVILKPENREVHEARVRKRGRTTMSIFNYWFFSVELSQATEEASNILVDSGMSKKVVLSNNDEANFVQNIAEVSDFFEIPVK